MRAFLVYLYSAYGNYPEKLDRNPGFKGPEIENGDYIFELKTPVFPGSPRRNEGDRAFMFTFVSLCGIEHRFVPFTVESMQYYPIDDILFLFVTPNPDRCDYREVKQVLKEKWSMANYLDLVFKGR